MARKPLTLILVSAVATLAAAAPASATFPGRNGLFVYTTVDGVHTARIDGSHDRLIAALPGTRYASWSPNGRRIAFVASTGEPAYDLFVVGRKGRGLRRLTYDGALTQGPTWSPDGKWIGYSQERPSAPDANQWAAYAIRAGGSRRRVIFEPGPDAVSNLAWSPRGGKLAFVRDSELFVGDFWGQDAKQLTDLPDDRVEGSTQYYGQGAGGVNWSPGGRWIAFVVRDGGPCDFCSPRIWKIHPGGTGLTQLTGLNPGDTDYDTPLWAPDRSAIAMCQPEWGAEGMAKMDPDGSNQRTAGRAFCADDWQALP